MAGAYLNKGDLATGAEVATEALAAAERTRDAARTLLAPLYAWFTEGFFTRDLREVKALLEELRS